MPHGIFASDSGMVGTLKDIMAIIGTVAAIVGAVVGMTLAVRKASDKRRKQQRDDDKMLSGKFAAIQETLGRLETRANALAEIHSHAEQELKELTQKVESIHARCTRHQQQANLEEVTKDLQRVVDRLDRAERDLSDHREQVSQRYMTLASYQNDLLMWTNNFDALRQSIRDLTLMIDKAGRRS